VERPHALGGVSRADEGRLRETRRGPAPSRRGVPRAGRCVRQPGDPAGPRRAVDVGRVGPRGRGDRVGRHPATTAPGADLRPGVTVSRRRGVPRRPVAPHRLPARYPAQAVTPLMVVALGASAMQERHPLAHLGYVGWPLAFAAHVFLLRRHEAPGSHYQYWAHAVGVWLLAALGSWEIGWGI